MPVYRLGFKAPIPRPKRATVRKKNGLQEHGDNLSIQQCQRCSPMRRPKAQRVAGSHWPHTSPSAEAAGAETPQHSSGYICCLRSNFTNTLGHSLHFRGYQKCQNSTPSAKDVDCPAPRLRRTSLVTAVSIEVACKDPHPWCIGED